MTDRSPTLWELCGERLDDALHAVRDVAKRADHWKAFYGITGIAESYLMHDTNLHIHLFATNRPDVYVMFERHPDLDSEWPAQGALRTDHGLSPDVPPDENDQTVFVGVVQLVKKPKGAPPTPIPSVVRLRRIDSCRESPFEVPELPSLEPGFGLRPGTAQIHGELGLPLTEAIRPTWCRDDGELANELLKGGSEIVGDFPDDNRPLDGEFDLSVEWGQLLPTCRLVELSDSGGANVTVKEPMALELKRAEVFIGYLDLVQGAQPADGSWLIQFPHAQEAEAAHPKRRADPEDRFGIGDPHPEAGRVLRAAQEGDSSV